MNFYRRLGRFYIDFEFSVGRYPPPLSGSVGTISALNDWRWKNHAEHPFQDPEALTGNVTTPAGAQSGEVVDVTRAAYNPVSQSTGD